MKALDSSATATHGELALLIGAVSSLCDAIRHLERVSTSAVARLEVQEVTEKREAAERTIMSLSERLSA